MLLIILSVIWQKLNNVGYTVVHLVTFLTYIKLCGTV
jgi:hypothetical protein